MHVCLFVVASATHLSSLSLCDANQIARDAQDVEPGEDTRLVQAPFLTKDNWSTSHNQPQVKSEGW